MSDLKVEPIQPSFGLTNDKHNRAHRGSDLTHKASTDEKMNKSFNNIFEDLKKANLKHEKGVEIVGRKSNKILKNGKPVIEEDVVVDVDVKYDTRSKEIPEQCLECARRDRNICTAKKFFVLCPCDVRTGDYTKVIKELDELIAYNKARGNTSQLGKFNSERKRLVHLYSNEVNKAYLEDKHRGSGGGGSKNEGGRGVKSLMKDNSAREVKERVKYEREYYKDALEEFEEKNGPLDKLKPDDGITRSKIDSYTGEEIEVPEKKKRGRKKC